MRCFVIFCIFVNFLGLIGGSREITKRPAAQGSAANKWCGLGDVQDDKHEDAWFNATDKCCREHAACSNVIGPGENKYGLQNYGAFPAFECSCDIAFKNCLGEADDEFLSFIVQMKYFSALPIRCFNLVNGVAVWNETLSIRNVINDLTSVILDDINDYFLIERRI